MTVAHARRSPWRSRHPRAVRLGRAVWRGATTGVALVVCAVALVAAIAAASGHRPVVVMSGSMGESVPVGSVALAAPTDDVEVGDVLVMRSPGRPTVTHRVVGISLDAEGRRVATTRGDANPDIDPVVHRLDGEQLTVRRVVPGLGRLLVELKSPVLGGSAVVVLVLVFLAGALRRIWGGGRSRVPRAPALPVPMRRDRMASAVVAGAAAAVVGLTASLALYGATATADLNQFATRECYDARLHAVQRGSVVSTTDGVSAIAITPVDPARSFVLFSSSSAASEPDESTVAVRLASASVLEVVRASDGAPPGTVHVEWSVVEYACGVGVQRGAVTGTGAGPVDVPIAAVDPASSFVLAGALAPAGSTEHDGTSSVSATLLDEDTVRVDSSGGVGSGVRVEWQVVTFDDAADAAVQTVTASLAAGDGSTTVDLAAGVARSSTMVIAAVRSPNTGSAIGDRLVRVRLLDDRTVEVVRAVTSGSVEVDVQVIEFRDGTTVQHGVLDLAAAQFTATATMPPVTTSRSTVVATAVAAGGTSGGSTAMVSDDVVGEGTARVRLADSRTVEVRRDASTSTASFAWQVVTWGGPAWADLGSPFRRRIDVVAGSVATPDGYTTSLTFDHAAMVTAGQSLANGDDVRIWRHDGVTWAELDRVLADTSSWNAHDTTVWFRTREPIAAGDTVSYWMYLGDTTPSPPLDDPDSVWLVAEDFESGGLGAFEDRTGGTGWYRAQPWTRRWVLTVPAGSAAADLVDEPVLVRLTSAELAAHAQADGSDLRFVAADGVTRLAHEIEAYDPVTGALTAWVRVPTVWASADTTILLFAGASDAPAQADPRAVWGDAVAWHLAADPAGSAPTLDDSGTGRLDGLALADAAASTDPTGPAVALDGTLDRLESAPFVPPRAALTVAAWFRVDDDSREQVIVAQGDPAAAGSFELAVRPGAGGPVLRSRLRIDGHPVEVEGGSVTAGTWHHAVATWDGLTVQLFLDGAQVGSVSAPGALVVDGPIPAVIGAAPDGGRALDGVIGQIRVEDRPWSAARIAFVSADLHDPAATVTAAASTAGTWFDQGTWAERRPLSIESDLVSGSPTDYPVLVQLVDAGLAAGLRADAADLVFTAADGVTRLDHQVERWDPVTGSLTAWVRVPVLSDTADVVLHLYLGNPTAVDQQDPVGVWGPDADLVLVD